jgi:predicted cupin superfamily sugar epimerase
MTPRPPRAEERIRSLAMQPHPEGGYYAEAFRSRHTVAPRDGRGERPALTAIYFLLLAGQKSAWHLLASDEVWIHFEGAPVRLWTFDPRTGAVAGRALGPLATGQAPQREIPAGTWQAAEPLGEYALTGACVGPGFVFEDFRLLRDDPDGRAALMVAAPELLRLA